MGADEYDSKLVADYTASSTRWPLVLAHGYALFDNSYQVLNTDNAFYVVNKWPAAYPPPLKKSQAFTGNPAGGPFAPDVCDVKNATNNPPRGPNVQGHLVALWND
ncbi:Beta-hexosaminidase [Tolypocladium paradoxum]|uniref:Beta-hexosaminidase n=1 Tax=Tolypocladium paradoxum TaxID=94208 RepID=A0A2S4L8X1_9HYPO|nr:Beta-hexosaminidase [Tolypocladium paradoxum]